MAETKQVILIGTAHPYQESGKPGADGLKAFAERLFCKSGIGAIGEEMNREASEEGNVSSSVGADLGRALDIPHRYCDPDRNARVRTGIPQENEIRASAWLQNWSKEKFTAELRASERKREQYWLSQLIDQN
jgi:hypothetical protein